MVSELEVQMHELVSCEKLLNKERSFLKTYTNMATN